jgi:hypothetical protein
MKDVVTKTLEEITVSAQRRIDTKSYATKQSITAEKLRELPVNTLRDVVRMQAGGVTQGEGVHIRGGRSGERQEQRERGRLGHPARARHGRDGRLAGGVWRGRLSGFAARQSLASAIKSASEPQPSSRCQASDRSAVVARP